MPYLGVFCNRLNGMGAQKNVLLEKVVATFFPGIFYVKTKWDGLRILGGKNLCKRRKFLTLNASNVD